MLNIDQDVNARAALTVLLAICAAIVPAGPANAESNAADAAQEGGLTVEELEAEPPDADLVAFDDLEPVAAADASDVRIAPLIERGYLDEEGRYVIDLMEDDYVYIAVRVETEEGRPVEDAEPALSIVGTSQLLTPEDVSMSPTTDQYGIIEFAVVAGDMGLDRVGVEYDDANIEILINVISLRANDVSLPEVGEGYLPWDELLKAEVRYEDMILYATFPEVVSERSGDTVKMAGFMMPLETGMTQQWFLLTSHPPGCYFHVPGGPAGAVEVFAAEGIDIAWGPIVLEGQFRALAESESAVYRLDDARLVEQ